MNSDRRWTTRHVTIALELYRQGLSMRSVAAELSCQFSPAPSHEWVREQVARAGITRSRARAQELREARERGQDYDELRRQASVLVARGWSPRVIARHLGVSRQFARRVCQLDDYLGDTHGRKSRTSRGMFKRLWLADLPDTRARRDRLDRVARLRLAGKSYAEIAEATGVPMGSITHILRCAGILPERRRS